MRITHNARLKTLFVVSALLSFLPAMAEGLWGAKASIDINVPGKWKTPVSTFNMYKTGVGFSLGGVYCHYITDNFYLEPSLSLFYDCYSSDLSIQAEEGSDEVDPTVYKVGLRLPVVVGFTYDITDDFAISVFIGPELDYAFAGGYRLKNKALKDEISDRLFGKEDGMQRRFSCSWKGGLGFPFSNWRVDIEAVIGLTDIIVGPASMKENRVSLSLLRYF